MSAINPAELMRATAVTRIYSRSMQKRETPPLPASTPTPRDIIYYRPALYFVHPLYRATRRNCLLHFPVWTLHLIAFPRQVCRLWGPLFYAVITSPGSSPTDNGTGISRFDNIIVALLPPPSLFLISNTGFRGISPPKIRGSRRKILLIHGTNEGSSLISLEKFRKGINWVQSFNLYWYTIQGCGKIEEEIIVRLDRSAWSSVNATISQRLHSDRVYTGVRVCVCVRRARFDVALKAFLFFLGYV